MNEFADLCNDANRIAAQLRGHQPLVKKVKLNVPKTPSGRPVRAPMTGVAGKGGWLRAKKSARLSEVLAFCHAFFEQNDQLPPQASVAAHFGVCEQAAQEYMRALGREKHLERNAVGKWRFARDAR